MDDAERKRLRQRFREMCEGAGYPDGERPRPWDIDTKKAEREARLQQLADNQEDPEEEPAK